jgi:hypothetical protein
MMRATMFSAISSCVHQGSEPQFHHQCRGIRLGLISSDFLFADRATHLCRSNR